MVGGQVRGSRLCVRDEGNCANNFPHPGCIACCPAPHRRSPTTKALHTICDNNTSIVSSSWWWAYKCPKHVEQIISAIKHSVASSWFYSLRLYYDVRTNIHPMPLHVSSTNVLIIRRSKLYYTASGIITLKQVSGLKLLTYNSLNMSTE